MRARSRESRLRHVLPSFACLPDLRRLLTALVLLTLALATAGAARADVPADGAELANGSVVTGDCLLQDQVADSRRDGWFVFRIQPNRIHSTGKGQQLIPSPLPTRPEKVPQTTTGQWAPPVGGENSSPEDCVVADYGNLFTHEENGGLAIDEPGVYWHYQVRATVHWVWHTFPYNSPPPTPCAGNDSEYPNPANLRHPPSLGPNGGWDIDTFCNTVVSHRFYVVNDPGECEGGILDRSNWPFTTYFNQYDAGIREDLPKATDWKKGGNACGPSSTLMAALQSIRHDFPGDTPAHQEEFMDRVDAVGSLPHVYDQVMGLTRAQQQDGAQNAAYGTKIATFLQSLGWTDAQVRGLGSTQTDIFYLNHKKIVDALVKNPVIISTAFGGARWGTTGGGHVIMIRNLDVQHPTDYIVNDPAGNWFGTHNKGSYPTGHYGAGSCGEGVPYPMDWLEAYTTGRWLVDMGKPEGARGPFVTPLRGSTDRQTMVAAGGTGGQAVISLTVPAASAPATFYLQDAEGRKTGFVDGQPVNQIPHSWAQEANEGDGGPGDEDTPDGGAPVAMRSLSVPRPAAGTTLHVSDPSGGTFSLAETAMHTGELVAHDTIEATVAAGGDATPATPALGTAIEGKAPAGGEQPSGGDQPGTQQQPGAGTPQPGGGPATPDTSKPVGGTGSARAVVVRTASSRRAVRVTVRCASTQGCRVVLLLTARRGGRTVTVGTARAVVKGQRTLTIRLNRAGARMLRGHARLATRLIAKQDGTALGKPRAITVRAR